MDTPIWEFEAIGTHWKIFVFDTYTLDVLTDVFSQVQQRIAEFDKNYSRFRSDSLVTAMSQAAGEYVLPYDAKPMFDLYRRVFDATGGLVTPLIGQVLVDAGYDAKYSLTKKEMTAPKVWDDALDYDFPKLTVRESVLLDFGAAGKGYLIDIVGELLEKNSILSYCIDAGGDMRHRSATSQTFRVGLEHPSQIEEVIGVATICNQSLCGSAGNRRKWADMHHIIDPIKLESPNHILAVWIIAESTILADILTTALFFVSPEKLEKEFRFEYLILNSDFSISSSTGFPAELFTK